MRKFPYNNWQKTDAAGRQQVMPDPRFPARRCGRMLSSGLVLSLSDGAWANDMPCTTKLPAVCELPL